MFTLSSTLNYTRFTRALTVQMFKRKYRHPLSLSFFLTEKEQLFSTKEMYLYTCTYNQFDPFDDSNDIRLERRSGYSRTNCLNCIKTPDL